MFTGDNSRRGLSDVCVSELFNFAFCFYEEIFMPPSPSVYLMLINITLRSSAAVSLESDSSRSPRAVSLVCRAFHETERTAAILLAVASPELLGNKKPTVTSTSTWKTTLQLNLWEMNEAALYRAVWNHMTRVNKKQISVIERTYIYFLAHIQPKNKKNQRLFSTTQSKLRNVLWFTWETSGEQRHL